MKVSYSLTEKEYREANRVVGGALFGMQRRVRWFLLAMAAVTVLGVLAWLSARAAGVLGLYLGMILGLSLVLAAVKILPRVYTPTNPHGLFVRQMLTASRRGVAFTSRYRTENIEWPFFIGYRETPSLFLLHIEPGQAKIVPKRIFSSAAERDEFAGYLREKLPRLG
ncbi:MAG TPA: YcxB family protein [Sphingomonadales bacterium]|nr:YcxB family protein [Sphingomonadales bacterium]